MTILPIVRKEFRQIRRDKRALGILIFLPGFLLILVGYALNFDVKHVGVAVLDEDRTPESRRLAEGLTNSEYLEYTWSIRDRSEVDAVLDGAQARVVLIIPRGFSHTLLSGSTATVQVLVDGSNPNSASISAAYMLIGIRDYSSRILTEWMDRRGMEIALPVDIRPRLWFNPELKTAKFLVPGVFGLILLLSTVISTSLSVVREKELGTMEQLKTSPLHAYEIIIGKALPYVGIALVAATIILLMGWGLFDVTVRGSLLLLYGAILLFLLAGLGQGLLISAVAQTQQVAFFLSVFSSLLPTFLLSGFVFPLKSMPWLLQGIGAILPTKYFLIIVRSIILKDVGFWPLWPEFLALGLFTLATVTISSIRLHRDLSS
ncbi:MAG: ABC transporter permease [Bacteroidetes bacterium]|jgi:ABC-2 type transport system permease protein|nr:ABC transporter permease [Bacteroidota bacterium]